MRTRRSLPLAATSALALAMLAGCATTPVATAPVQVSADEPLIESAALTGRDETMLATEAFLSAHPDLRFRTSGVRAYREGRLDEALEHFTRAARHADKPSQAMIGELYWTGQGVPVDRALGYAWMDLAAERQYRGFLVMREQYWARMSPEEQARAVEVGQALYAEYGDAVAKPRLARVMRREMSSSIGMRPGAGGAPVTVTVAGPAGEDVTVTDFFNRRYWDPTEYFRWQDQVWRAPERRARVSVGELEALGAGREGDAAGAGEAAQDAPAEADPEG